jgi:hypothetical protein
MTSPTSPYLFKEGSEKDILFIEKGLKENPFAIFIRKIACEFPDEILNDFIYCKTKEGKLWIVWLDLFFWRKCLFFVFYGICSISFIMIIGLWFGLFKNYEYNYFFEIIQKYTLYLY